MFYRNLLPGQNGPHHLYYPIPYSIHLIVKIDGVVTVAHLQVEIWFSILPRKVLLPNHFQSVMHLKQAPLDFIQYHNRTAKPIKWSYTIAKLEKKFGDETQDSVLPGMLELVDQLAPHEFWIPAYTVETSCLAA